MTPVQCRSCERGWEHCHGTLIEQPDDTVVCSDEADCVLPAAAHEHVEPSEQP